MTNQQRGRLRLRSDTQEGIRSFTAFLALILFLAAWGAMIWYAQGPYAHKKVVQLQREYKNRTGTVVAETSILPDGGYGGLEDHRVATVRFAGLNGEAETTEFPVEYQTKKGEPEHLVVDREGVAWAEGDLRTYEEGNPLKPGQAGWVFADGVLLGAVVAACVALTAWLVLWSLGMLLAILLVALAKRRSTPSTA